jgi:hypothetical protein
MPAKLQVKGIAELKVVRLARKQWVADPDDLHNEGTSNRSTGRNVAVPRLTRMSLMVDARVWAACRGARGNLAGR